MKTIRRLYFYAVALISIEVVLWGTIGLLRSIFNPNLSGDSYTLAGALAAIIVGVPIFLVHWLWAQSVSAKDDEERTASLRAIFLYGVLLGTGIPAVQNLLAFINRIFLSGANLYASRAIVGSLQTWSDNLIAIIINVLIGAYFWYVLRAAWASLPAQDEFADIRRLARILWMLYGLLLTIYGAQQALDYIFTLSSTTALGEMGGETVVNAIALMLVGAPIWFFAWRLMQDALADSAEKDSPLRLGILYLLALGGVITVLTTGGILLSMILRQIFGEGLALSEFIQQIGTPISIGVPFAVIWGYYGNWLNRQFLYEEDEAKRSAKKRLYFYILSLLGLGVLFFGLVSLISLVIDLVSGQEYLSGGGFRSPLADSLASILVGLPLWYVSWRPMQADGLREDVLGDHARRSVIRKTYLYFVIFAMVLGGMGSAGSLLYTVFTNLLGGSAFNFGVEIANEFQVFVLCVILLVYHLLVLRRDGTVRADELEKQQSGFNVLVFDHDGKFGEVVKTSLLKTAPGVQVSVVAPTADIPADKKFNAVIFAGSLAVNTPPKAEAWIRAFNGNKLVVQDDAAGIYWVNDSGAAADSVRALAEGQEIRPHSQNRLGTVWTYVAYVFAVLFACQLLFLLITLGVSLVINV